jgi:hypothetical protein
MSKNLKKTVSQNEGDRIVRALFPAASDIMLKKLSKLYYELKIDFDIEVKKQKLLQNLKGGKK